MSERTKAEFAHTSAGPCLADCGRYATKGSSCAQGGSHCVPVSICPLIPAHNLQAFNYEDGTMMCTYEGRISEEAWVDAVGADFAETVLTTTEAVKIAKNEPWVLPTVIALSVVAFIFLLLFLYKWNTC